jgi:GNAT acetyltransferase-like protein
VSIESMETTVRVETPRTLSAPEWLERVSRCHGNPLHLVAPHLVENEATAIRLLVFEQEQEVVAVAPAVERRPRRLGLPLGRPVLTLPTTPALRQAAQAPAVLEALLQEAKRSGYTRLVIQAQSSAHLEAHALCARHATPTLVEFVLDLQRPFETILAGMHKVHRKNMRRAEARGLVIEAEASPASLERLRDMQGVSAQRASEREHGFVVRDAEYFRRAFEHVYAHGPGTVLFARRGGEYLAGLAYLAAAGRALTVRSGSFPAGYETDAMYLLHREMIRSLLAQGVVELNLGGVPVAAAEATHPQHGLFEFKKGFGGREVTRLSLDLPLAALP